MNIRLWYLYRDAGNNKKHNYVVYSNSLNLGLDEIQEIINAHLMDEDLFYADKWDLPDLHFDRWDEELDLEPHVFSNLELTDEEEEIKSDIKDLLNLIIN